MALNKFIAILVMSFTFSAFAQEMFLDTCINPAPHAAEIQNDIKWLKYFFKTQDCNVVVEKLTQLTSFNEFMVPQFKQPLHPFNWSNEFPYLSGVTKILELEYLPWSKLGFIPNTKNVFIHPELYSEFENFTVLDLTKSFNFHIQDSCNIRKILPSVKTLVVSTTDVSIMEKKCFDYSSLPWLIVEDWHGKSTTKLKDKIIGFKEFRGSIKDLISFRHLRYVGIDNWTVDNDLRFIGKNVNLTHVSLNIKHGVQNIDKLKYLPNLRSLTINCINNSSLNEYSDLLFIKPCNTPFLTDISFLLQIPYLEKLNLAANGLKDEDVSVISNLSNLKELNLSHNNLSSIPDLSQLKNLKRFDISNNPVSK